MEETKRRDAMMYGIQMLEGRLETHGAIYGLASSLRGRRLEVAGNRHRLETGRARNVETGDMESRSSSKVACLPMNRGLARPIDCECA